MPPTRIMIVEDEALVAANLKMLLESQGHRVSSTAYSGEEAVQKAAEDKPDLILMDVSLKGPMDGIEAAEAIKPGFGGPIIFLTAYSDEQKLDRAKRVEPFAYLLKPINERELNITIEMALYKSEIDKRLQNRERWLSTVLSSIGEAVIATDTSGTVNYLNGKAAELTGWESDSALGRPLAGVFNAFDEAAGRPIEISWSDSPPALTGGPQSILITKEGARLPIEHNCSPIINDQGETLGLVIVFRDVSDRLEAEKALKKSEERYRTLMQKIKAAIIVLGRELEIRALNTAAAELLGRPPDLLMGRNIFESELTFFSAEGRPLSGKEFSFRELIKPNRIRREAIFGLESPKGEGLVWVLINADPLLDQSGRISEVIVTATDITALKNAEQQYRESENRLREVVQNMPVLVNAFDRDNRILFWNKECEKVTGYQAEEMLGRTPPPSLFNPAPKRPGSPPKIQADNFDFLDWEWTISCKDGTSRTVSFNNVSNKIPIPGWFAWFVGLDVTERRKAESALKENEERYRAMFEQNTAVQWLLDPETGKIIDANKAACLYYGYSRQELVGMPVWSINTSPREEIEETIRRLTKESGKYAHVQHKLAGGELRDVEIYSGPIHWQGRVLLYSIIQDITERKKADEELRAAHQRLLDIIEFLPDATFVINREKQVIAWNRAVEEMTGVKKKDIVGQKDYPYSLPFWGERRQILIDYIGREDEAARAGYENLTRAGLAVCAEAFLPSIFDGAGAHVWITASPLFDRTGNLVGAIESVRDLTQQKMDEKRRLEMEVHLRQAQKMEAIGTLAGGIAHDFNNILAAILGYSELALADLPPKSPAEDSLKQVLRAVRRARNLVKQILSFSRRSEQEKTPVIVESVIKEALKLLRASLPATIEIKSGITRSDSPVLADPTQLHQLLMNLCTNAAQAMQPKGGVLEVRLEPVTIIREDEPGLGPIKPGSYQKLTVKDTGKGMDPKTLDRIFDPFYTTKAPGEGTGMGLAVVHGIVEAHQGKIFVESRLGEGSTFRVFLPLTQMPHPARAKQSLAPPLSKGTEKILFVDDEQHLVEIGKKLLESMGYKVTATPSPGRALELFRADPSRFDLVITDQTMPGMTGLELAGELLNLRPQMPVILCTGFSQNVTPEAAAKAGIKKFLLKPVDAKELAEAVREALLANSDQQTNK